MPTPNIDVGTHRKTKLFIIIRSTQIALGFFSTILMMLNLGQYKSTKWVAPTILVAITVMLVLCTIIAFLGNRLTSILSATVDLFGTMLLLIAAPSIFSVSISPDCNVPDCQTRAVNAAFGLVIINIAVYIASVVMESVALYQTHHSASAAGLGFRALYGVNQKQESEVVDVEAAMYELEAPQPPGLPLAALRACGSLDDETMAARKSRRNELPGATNIASS